MERYFIPSFNTDLVLRFSNAPHQLPVSQYIQGTLTSLTLERTSSYRKMLPSPSWFFPHTGHTLEDVLYISALISESTGDKAPRNCLESMIIQTIQQWISGQMGVVKNDHIFLSLESLFSITLLKETLLSSLRKISRLIILSSPIVNLGLKGLPQKLSHMCPPLHYVKNIQPWAILCNSHLYFSNMSNGDTNCNYLTESLLMIKCVSRC